MSKALCCFLLSIKKEIDKSYVVRKYEIGMSLLFKKYNYTISYFLDSSIINNPINYNLPLYHPYILIKNYKFPFLKIGTFRYPYISNIHNKYKNIVKNINGYYDIKLIENHLNRILFHCKNDKIIKFGRFREFNKYFINKTILSFSEVYNHISGKYQILIYIMNSIKITINIPDKYSYLTIPQFKKYLFYD